MMDNTFEYPTEHTDVEDAARSREEDFDKAVERVYRKYGSDLAAFFKDVQEELALKRHDAQGNKTPSPWIVDNYEG